MITIMARLTAKPGSEGKLRLILLDLVGATRKEAGCVSYELFHNEDNPIEFVTVERWREQAAADAHMETEHVALAVARGGEFLAQTPLIHRFAPVE